MSQSNASSANQTGRQEMRQAASDYIYNLKTQSFPNSKKIYVDGDNTGVRVGMREISLSDTFAGGT